MPRVPAKRKSDLDKSTRDIKLWRAQMQAVVQRKLSPEIFDQLLQVGLDVALDPEHSQWKEAWKEMVNRGAGKLNQTAIDDTERVDPRTAIVNVLQQFGLPVHGTRGYAKPIPSEVVAVVEASVPEIPMGMDYIDSDASGSGEGQAGGLHVDGSVLECPEAAAEET